MIYEAFEAVYGERTESRKELDGDFAAALAKEYLGSQINPARFESVASALFEQSSWAAGKDASYAGIEAYYAPFSKIAVEVYAAAEPRDEPNASREIMRKRSFQLMSAFPTDEPSIPIVGLTGEAVSDTAVSTFNVCRLCGSLVLSSMLPTHILAFDHDRDEIMGITR